MQVSTEKKEGLKHVITITVPAADVKNFYQQALRKVAKSARIDGFRKGHVPTNVLEQRFMYDIIEQTHDAIFKETLYKAVTESKLKVVNTPELALVDNNFSADKDFVYTATVEVEPEFALKPVADLKLKHFKSELADADVEKMVENLREQQGKWQAKDDLAISAETLANIAFTLSVDGKEVENGGSDNFNVQPGKTSLIEGFSDQLLGHKAGDKFVIKATFPTPYHNEELAGKEGTFDVTVNSVSERILPEVDADFVRIYGIKDGNIDAFRDALRKNMQRELNKALYARTSESLFDALCQQYNDLEVPETMVNAEVERLKENMKKNIQAQFGFTPKDDMLKSENFKDQAVNNTRLGFILRALEAELKIGEPSEELVNTLINQYAEAFENVEEVVKSIRKDKKAMANFFGQAYEHHVVEAVMDKACDGETVLSFEELTSRK